MNDDWRLRIATHDEGLASSLAERLDAHEIERDLEQSFHDRVVVSVDGADVFCYGAVREQLDAARRVIEKLAADQGWQLEFELRHWHPSAEQWEDPDTPLPDSDADLAREHRERIAQEREESAQQGYPEYEVRVQCESRRAAAELAEKLRGEGIPVVHHWSHLLVGALDEETGKALAQRLRAEAPAGSEVKVEENLRAVYEERPFRPFAYLGGLGG
ncbi:MAG TPA: hypothetical protein VGH45_12640 [Solirubrobacteraceae bacterium]|jgi:hypothetical protein